VRGDAHRRGAVADRVRDQVADDALEHGAVRDDCLALRNVDFDLSS
jgi:hypothetical protein